MTTPVTEWRRTPKPTATVASMVVVYDGQQWTTVVVTAAGGAESRSRERGARDSWGMPEKWRPIRLTTAATALAEVSARDDMVAEPAHMPPGRLVVPESASDGVGTHRGPSGDEKSLFDPNGPMVRLAADRISRSWVSRSKSLTIPRLSHLGHRALQPPGQLIGFRRHRRLRLSAGQRLEAGGHHHDAPKSALDEDMRLFPRSGRGGCCEVHVRR